MCFGTSPVSKQRTVPGNGHRQLPAGARIPFGFGFLFSFRIWTVGFLPARGRSIRRALSPKKADAVLLLYPVFYRGLFCERCAVWKDIFGLRDREIADLRRNNYRERMVSANPAALVPDVFCHISCGKGKQNTIDGDLSGMPDAECRALCTGLLLLVV